MKFKNLQEALLLKAILNDGKIESILRYLNKELDEYITQYEDEIAHSIFASLEGYSKEEILIFCKKFNEIEKRKTKG